MLGNNPLSTHFSSIKYYFSTLVFHNLRIFPEKSEEHSFVVPSTKQNK